MTPAGPPPPGITPLEIGEPPGRGTRICRARISALELWSLRAGARESAGHVNLLRSSGASGPGHAYLLWSSGASGPGAHICAGLWNQRAGGAHICTGGSSGAAWPGATNLLSAPASVVNESASQGPSVQGPSAFLPVSEKKVEKLSSVAPACSSEGIVQSGWRPAWSGLRLRQD